MTDTMTNTMTDTRADALRPLRDLASEWYAASGRRFERALQTRANGMFETARGHSLRGEELMNCADALTAALRGLQSSR